MEKAFTYCISLVLLLMLALPQEINAANQSRCPLQVSLQKQTVKYDNEEHDQPPTERHRLPSRLVQGMIGMEEGVCIADLTSEISTYEIWDTVGETCIYTTSDESEFINTLFAGEGAYVVRFSNSDYVYSGYVEL